MRGLTNNRDKQKCLGNAVKIVTPGAYPHIGKKAIVGTDKKDVWKRIYCGRDPRWVSQSQTDIQGGPEIKVASEDGWEDLKKAPNPSRFTRETVAYTNWLLRNEEVLNNTLNVDHDIFCHAPEFTIDEICTFLGYQPTPQQRQAAIDNVNPKLRRSADGFVGWPKRYEKMGECATALYEGLKTSSKPDLQAAKTIIDSEMLLQKLESNTWYDKATGLVVSARLYRKMQLPESTAYLEKIREMYIRELRRGLHFHVASDYSVSDEEYTVKRPGDLGDLVRNKVSYNGVIMTEEAAFTLHTQLWLRSKAATTDEKTEAFISTLIPLNREVK